MYETFKFSADLLEQSEQKLKGILDKTNKSDLNLISFALQEKTPREAVKDLTAKFSENDALTIVYVVNNDAEEFTRLLQSKLSVDHVKEEQEQHKDATRPYVGQILYSIFGYDCTLVRFYQVVKVTKCFVTVRQLKRQTTKNCDGYGQQTMERPLKNQFDENYKPLRRKINHFSENSYSIDISPYETADPWNGNDVYEDTLD